MAFNSLDYVLFFTTILLVTWSLARFPALRLLVLLAASVFAYMCSKKIYILLVAVPTFVDYFVAIAIAESDDPKRRKLLLGISITLNLALLGTFKYFDWCVQNVADLLSALHLIPPDTSLPLLKLALPVGISFYTFQTMAYVIDVYRGTWGPIRSFLNFSLVITFFPHFVAGPIVLAKELSPQFDRPPRITMQQFGDGLFLILKGLIKKVAVADWIGVNFVDRVYGKPDVFTSAEVLLALYGYSMQIYCDFSGYTDIAIGSAKLLGYELPENFRRPYLAQSVAHFWRRWHMTLSRWVREYIYFPLGGTHKGQARAYANTVLTLVIMGIWHGANWTFFWYGVIHGIAVCINRYTNQRRKHLGLTDEVHGFALVWRVFLTFQFVSLARILFRSQSMKEAGHITSRLFTGDWSLEHLHWSIYVMLAVTYAIHWTPRSWVEWVGETFNRAPVVSKGLALASVGALMLHLSNVQPVPFIYFAF